MFDIGKAVLESELWTKQSDHISQSIRENKAVGIIGLYGVGKKKLAQKTASQIDTSILIDLSGPEPKKSSDIYSSIFSKLKNKKLTTYTEVPRSDFDFHYFLKEVVSHHEITIIFTESQHLLKLPETFWDNLESLRYYSKNKIHFVFFGQPSFHSMECQGSKRLLQNNYIFIKPFTKKCVFNLVQSNEKEFLITKNCLWKYSKGHYGTIKWLLKYKISSLKNFNIQKKSDPFLPFWIDQMFSQFNTSEQSIISHYVTHKTIPVEISKSNSFTTLIELGLFSKNKNEYVFLFDAFIDLLVEKINKSTKNKTIEYKDNTIYIHAISTEDIFSSNENKIVALLLQNKNKYCTYEEVSQVLWQNNTESFSLWAISKHISRIRNKMQQLGLSKKCIQTKSGIGYKLEIP